MLLSITYAEHTIVACALSQFPDLAFRRAEIADALGIKPNTCAKHLRNLKLKFLEHTDAAAIQRAAALPPPKPRNLGRRERHAA